MKNKFYFFFPWSYQKEALLMPKTAYLGKQFISLKINSENKKYKYSWFQNIRNYSEIYKI